MNRINEQEFARLCDGIYEDRASICRHNPIGSRGETLLWMLLSVLVSYLSLEDAEIPCFPGKPTAETYRQAILHVLRQRATEPFAAEKYLDKLEAPEMQD